VPVQRPGGKWMTAEQHLDHAARLRRRADARSAAQSLTRRPRTSPSMVMPARVREARPRSTARAGPSRARSPDRPSEDPEPPLAVAWEGLAASSARLKARLRRRDGARRRVAA
jgi:hypothetical protein